MSVVAYNGITLPYAFTTRFDQSPVRDEVGNTDRYCTKIDFQCNAVLNMDYIGMIAPEFIGRATTTAALMKAIRNALMEPRKRFSITFNGVELLPFRADVPGYIDVMNGPTPQSCTITELTNTTFFVTYHVIAHYWEKYEGPQAGLSPPINKRGCPVLYNRWTESVDIDNANFTTRTREGKFKIRSDNAQGYTVDELRSVMCLLSVPNGFLRQSSRYRVSPDGLAIEYSITDKEVFKMPPVPAFEARGSYTESTSKHGAKRFGEVNVHLKGQKSADPNYSQAKLLETAMAVASRKISASNGQVGPIIGMPDGAVLESAANRVNLYENEVEVTMRVWYASAKPRWAGVALNRRSDVLGMTLTFTPFSDNTIVPKPPYDIRGSAQLLLQAAAYFDPSFEASQINRDTGQMVPGLAPGQAGRFG